MSSKRFLCHICDLEFLADEFVEEVDEWYGLREMRLLCQTCAPEFNNWNKASRLAYLQSAIENFFGHEQFIYALVDPSTESVRYIGRTNNIKNRLSRHLSGLYELAKEKCGITNRPKVSCRCKLHKDRSLKSSRYWIASLIKNGLRPRLVLLEKVEPAYLVVEKEGRWIAHFIQSDHELLNLEAQNSDIVGLVKANNISYLEEPVETLIESGFTWQFHHFLSRHGRYSNWEQAVFIHKISTKLASAMAKSWVKAST